MPDVLRLAAFTTDPRGGNPAGVVLDADGLDDATMQEVAADVGFSETAFVSRTGPDERHLAVRFFSPVAEVDFCGHATIATAVALAERDGAGPLRLDTAAGEIAVETVRVASGFAAALRSVPTHTRPASEAELTAALGALGWSRDDLDPRLAPHVAFAGNEHLLLAVGSRDRLAALDYDFDALRELMLERGWTTLQLFWPQDETTIHSRNPFPVGGVVEDPATGAAAAALGGYLRSERHVSVPTEITIVQGEDMGRRSELLIAVDPSDPRVTVSGTAVRL